MVALSATECNYGCANPNDCEEHGIADPIPAYFAKRQKVIHLQELYQAHHQMSRGRLVRIPKPVVER